MDRVRAYTVLELTEILQVTRRTIYNYIKKRKFAGREDWQGMASKRTRS
jgi:transcriptional antiterminator